MTLRAFEKYIPGLELIRTYKREWFQGDLLAGLSVAAVALPVGIAYAQLAGFPPAVGIYSSILSAIAYAFFRSSRQLVVNPDSAACMGCDTLEELRRELAAKGIVLVIVRAKGLFRTMMQRSGLLDTFGHERFFYSIHTAVLAFREVISARDNDTGAQPK